jgi:hypothetical protein
MLPCCAIGGQAVSSIPAHWPDTGANDMKRGALVYFRLPLWGERATCWHAYCCDRVTCLLPLYAEVIPVVTTHFIVRRCCFSLVNPLTSREHQPRLCWRV